MSDPNDEAAALKALEYTDDWLLAGILDTALLLEQFERMQSGGTQKTARYRAQAVTAWLATDAPLTDEEVDDFLMVMKAETDAKFSNSCVAELIQSPRLGHEQLERVARSDEKLMRRHEPLIRRIHLKHQMESGVTDEHMTQVIDYKDAAIQTSLLRDPRLTKKHAELLAKRGANPTIREKAHKWFLDKKFWKG